MQNFVSDSGSQAVASETEATDSDEVDDPTVPKRDLSPLEPTEEELQQPEDED